MVSTKFFKRPQSFAGRSILAIAFLAVALAVGWWAGGYLAPTGASDKTKDIGAASGALSPLRIIGANRTWTFQVELADTDAERAQGLMFRRSLGADRGMLFDFGVEQEVTMWMRNTYIPLDMIFAASDGTITNIARRTTPHSEAVISSRGPVRFVLEVPAGTVSKLGLVPGDRLSAASIR